MITFYHRFLEGIAEVLSPLTDLLKGKPKSLQWNDDAEKSFHQAKDKLARATYLAYPEGQGRLAIYSDASDIAIGAVLQ